MVEELIQYLMLKMSSFLDGGIPFICGGYDYGNTYYDECYKYVAASDQWILSGTLSEERSFSGYDSSESWGLVMAGGQNRYLLNSVETTHNGETFAFMPDLPYANRDSCLTIIDNDMIFVSGGQEGPKDTWIFSTFGSSWQRFVNKRVKALKTSERFGL